MKQQQMQEKRQVLAADDLLLRRCGRWLVWLGLLALLWLGGLGAPGASATMLRTADRSEAIVVQSRRTLRDQTRQSWQIIAFKRVQPNTSEATVHLRLVGFPGQITIAHPSAATLVDGQQRWTLADRSDQISAAATVQANIGQYALQPVLPQLPTDRRLQLLVQTIDRGAIVLPIPPALIAEWQRVALVDAAQLVNACEQFPLEARQNPEFPLWTGCRIEPEGEPAGSKPRLNEW